MVHFKGKSLVKKKIESDFFPHFLSKIRKLENCENLFLLNYNWANFEQDQRNFFLKIYSQFSNLNRIFFHNFWAKSENSKIAKIYFLWTSSEPILSKIFFRKKKASVVVGIWKKNPKISQISNLESDFFLILQKKPPMFQNIRNLFVLNFIWANFQQNQRTFFDQ